MLVNQTVCPGFIVILYRRPWTSAEAQLHRANESEHATGPAVCKLNCLYTDREGLSLSLSSLQPKLYASDIKDLAPRLAESCAAETLTAAASGRPCCRVTASLYVLVWCAACPSKSCQFDWRRSTVTSMQNQMFSRPLGLVRSDSWQKLKMPIL